MQQNRLLKNDGARLIPAQSSKSKSALPVYTLSVASDLSGIPIHSIRQYVDNGLIIPFRKESGRHLYSETDIARLKYLQKLLNDNGLNFAGIKTLFSHVPCWAIRPCSLSERKECQAYNTDKYPCWQASEKGPACLNVDCRECDVYRVIENYQDIKSFIRKAIP